MAAYQSDDTISPTKILEMNLNRKYRVPDLVIYLDINPEISLARTRRRNSNEHFDNLTALNKVRLAYEKIIPDTALRLNATLPQNQLKEICMSHILI
jgi:thymidylate kinase